MVQMVCFDTGGEHGRACVKTDPLTSEGRCIDSKILLQVVLFTKQLLSMSLDADSIRMQRTSFSTALFPAR